MYAHLVIFCVNFGFPTDRLDHSKRSAKTETFNAEISPRSSKEWMRSNRTPARTAVKPIVPRAIWPPGIPKPSRRLSKCVSPTPSEKAERPRSQTLGHSCDALLHAQSGRSRGDARGANVLTIQVAVTYSLESDMGSFSVMGRSNNLQRGRPLDNFASCIQGDRAGMWEKIHLRVVAQALMIKSANHMISCRRRF